MNELPPKNLMFVADHLRIGGAERHMASLAVHLVRHGWQTSLAALHKIDDLLPFLNQNDVHDVVFCASRRGLDFTAVRRIAREAEQREISLLVATSQHSLLMAFLARRYMSRRIPLLFISHSMGHVVQTIRERIKFLVYRHFYNSVDRVVFVSHAQESYFLEMGVAPKSRRVIHNGVDLNRFRHSDDDRIAVRKRLGFADSDIVIGLCGGLRPEKRPQDLVSAIALLRSAGLPAKGLLIGEGIERPGIERQRHELGLDEHVVLVGLQKDTRPWVSACDIMTLVSSIETFPIATLESMAMAKPLVASDVAGIREQIDDGVSGLLYQSGDVAALAALLTSLFDPALRKLLGHTARSHMEAKFSEQLMLDGFEKEFLELAGS